MADQKKDQKGPQNAATETEQKEDRVRVGILRSNNKGAGIVELDRRHPEFGRTVYIPKQKLNGAPFDMKVVVKIAGMSADDMAVGEIIETLGDPGRPDVNILSIIHDFGLNPEYPQEVLDEVEDWPKDPDPETIQKELNKGRHDLRDQLAITIDGEDARDLDDAIAIEREGSNYRLWVHIADVSHYVQPGSLLDKEAYARGNSVYLSDRVLPMLPPKLSNQLCSLNPFKDRLCMTAEMLYDKYGNEKEVKLYPSVIQSKYRANYNEVYRLLTEETTPEEEDIPDWLFPKLQAMDELSDLLRKQRYDRGALVFDFPETTVDLDAEGKVIRIYGEEQTFANGIIESFMIAANEAVADYTSKHRLPVLYRVHEDPDPERMEHFRYVVRAQNVQFNLPRKITPKALQQLMERFKNEATAETLSYLMLRSLAKARYDGRNLGHFGLASESYLHFTAPIRRYSDLHTHRVLKRYLYDKSDKSGHLGKKIIKIANHVSETERNAIDAERASVDQKICEYYAERIGERYPVTISGFSSVAFYVRLQNTAEGSILYREMDDYYHFDELFFKAVTDDGRELNLGDELIAELVRVDMQRRFIDFAPYDFEPKKPGLQKSPPKVKRAKRNFSKKERSRRSKRGTMPQSRQDSRNKKSRRTSKRKKRR